MFILVLTGLIGVSLALTPEECILKLSDYTLDKPCASLLLSKVLGYGLVAASLLLKFPQILKIYSNSSVKGISLTSFYFELLGFSVMAAYAIHNKQPFSTYGEHAIITVQCIIQVLLFWSIGKIDFSHKVKIAPLFIFGWFLPLYGYGDLVPEAFWIYVPVYCLLMNLVVKLSQIHINYSNGSTGNLSFITCTMNLLGTLSRIFTTLTELNDPFLLFNYSVGVVLNGIIVIQFLIYWNTGNVFQKDAQKDVQKGD
jgi:mannose-P-dolichol utilization defect 1